MHDFYLTIPYGIILFCGGIIEFARKESTTSLVVGVGTGLLLFYASYLSLTAVRKRKNSSCALVLKTLCAGVLGRMMGVRYAETLEIMPAGVVAVISGVMVIFYMYKIATGVKYFSAKDE